jgi:hypothetical protein
VSEDFVLRGRKAAARRHPAREHDEGTNMNSKDHSHEWSRAAGAAVLGAVVMYMLDPDKGKRRRALIGDKAYSSDTRQALGAAGRDAAHRIEGLRARARRLVSDAPVPDDLQLIERVRARMGRLVAHPHAIQVGANNGRVTLSGPVLRHEVPRLLDAIRTVWGVASVEDRLVVYDSSDSISSLQGGTAERKQPSPLARARWAPAMQGAAILGGGLLALYGLRDRSLPGLALAGGGVALLLRGATNRPLARLVGIDAATDDGQRALPVAADSAAQAGVPQSA